MPGHFYRIEWNETEQGYRVIVYYPTKTKLLSIEYVSRLLPTAIEALEHGEKVCNQFDAQMENDPCNAK